MFTRLLQRAKSAEQERAQERERLAAKARTTDEEIRYQVLQIIQRGDSMVRSAVERDAIAAGEISPPVPASASSSSSSSALVPPGMLSNITYGIVDIDTIPWDSSKSIASRACNFCFSPHDLVGVCPVDYKAREVAMYLLDLAGQGWPRGKEFMRKFLRDKEADVCWDKVCDAAKRESDESTVLKTMAVIGPDPGKNWCMFCRRHVSPARHSAGPRACAVRTISSIIATKLVSEPVVERPKKRSKLMDMLTAFGEECDKIK